MSEEVHYTIHTNMVYLLISITIFLIITRILIELVEFPLFIRASRDVDIKILLLGLKNGLIDFYDPVLVPEGVPDWPPYYLYFWYFLFLPIKIIPVQAVAIVRNFKNEVIVSKPLSGRSNSLMHLLW